MWRFCSTLLLLCYSRSFPPRLVSPPVRSSGDLPCDPWGLSCPHPPLPCWHSPSCQEGCGNARREEGVWIYCRWLFFGQTRHPELTEVKANLFWESRVLKRVKMNTPNVRTDNAAEITPHIFLLVYCLFCTELYLSRQVGQQHISVTHGKAPTTARLGIQNDRKIQPFSFLGLQQNYKMWHSKLVCTPLYTISLIS